MSETMKISERPWFRHVPNALTVVRFLMIVPAVVLLWTGHRTISLAVYLLASATDVLDGWIARKYQLITDWGKTMDPLADKLMLLAVIATMMLLGDLPLWVVLIVLGKEAVQIIGGLVIYYGYGGAKIVIPANWAGKIATLFFTIAVVLTFLVEYTFPYNEYCMYFAVAFSVFAFAQYAVMTVRQVMAQRKA